MKGDWRIALSIKPKCNNWLLVWVLEHWIFGLFLVSYLSLVSWYIAHTYYFVTHANFKLCPYFLCWNDWKRKVVTKVQCLTHSWVDLLLKGKGNTSSKNFLLLILRLTRILENFQTQISQSHFTRFWFNLKLNKKVEHYGKFFVWFFYWMGKFWSSVIEILGNWYLLFPLSAYCIRYFPQDD